MSLEILDWLFLVLTLGILVAVVCFKILSDKLSEKRCSMMGVHDCSADMEDCREAADMMVRFIHEGMEGTGRFHDECNQAGCDGFFTLTGSADIAALVRSAHLVGGRLVVRRVDDKDIECEKNTVLEVKDALADMDYERSVRIWDKNRRR